MDSSLFEESLISRLQHYLLPERCLYCQQRYADRALFCSKCVDENPMRSAASTHALPYQEIYGCSYDGVARSLMRAAKFGAQRRALKLCMDIARPQLRALMQSGTLFLSLPSRRPFLRRLLQKVLPAKVLEVDAFTFEDNEKANATANKSLGLRGRYRRIYTSLKWKNPRLADVKRCVVCDDVSTSGATLLRAARIAQEQLALQDEDMTVWALMHRPRLQRNQPQ
jgi:predicted amidophosphoribosyltransferase